jgi:two-component system LytT family response regulator
MITAIIIDDEPHCVERLKTLLADYFSKNIRLAGSFDTVDKALQGIREIQPDLLFLDVQIHDKTGFDLLRETGEINFDIIFTTAYEKYAVQAFKFSAIDYLLKPIALDDLKEAIGKAVEKKSKDDTSKKIDVLLQNVQTASKTICVPVINGLVFVKVSDIIRCQGEVNYTNIFLTDKKKMLVAKTLKEFEELLTDYDFFRVHNSHLINLKHIRSYNKGKGGYVMMNDGSQIEVSTRRKEDFLKRLTKV